MSGARVIAAAVQVQVGARVHMVYKGALLPEGVDEETVDRLVAKGLVAKVKGGNPAETPQATQAGAAEEVPVEFPSKSWNHDRIDKWAGELDPPVTFDPAEKQTKEQKLEVLAPAIEAAKAAEQSEQQ